MQLQNDGLLKKVFAVLGIFAIIFITPSSFADDLINTITGESSDSAQVETVPTEETPAGDQPEPTASPSDTSTAQPLPSPIDTATAKPSATPSPTPTPPHAIINQSMRIVAPSEVIVDPRARSVFIPRVQVSNSGVLLICATSSISSFDANIANTSGKDEKSTLEVAGANSSYLRISSFGPAATAILNSGNGLRVFSTSRGIAGTSLQLKFVALSEVSTDPKLCNTGDASNTRTISLRGLAVDLNITKSGITLK
jgi:hypothetical protein